MILVEDSVVNETFPVTYNETRIDISQVSLKQQSVDVSYKHNQFHVLINEEY